MKVFKYIFAASIMMTLSLGLSSCDDALNLDPLDQVGGNKMWRNAADYKQFANNFYGWSRDFRGETSDIHSDLRSDLITYQTYNEFSHGSNTVPASDKIYTNNYANIRRTNMLLNNAKSFSKQNEIKQYIGEAHFFRAYCYFELLQAYGDVIITESVLDINSPEMKQARNSRGEVVDFIIKDLRNAIDELPDFASIGEDGYARISKEGAYAFLSRVALFEGTWQKSRGEYERGKELLAISEQAAKKVIDSKRFYLFGTQGASVALADSAYKYLFILENQKSNPAGLTKADNHEYIFAREHDETLKPIGTNITKGKLNNVEWITYKFAGMFLCSNGLPVEYNGTVNPLFQGYSEKNSEFMNRDRRMSLVLLQPGTRFFCNTAANCRVTWDKKDYEDPKRSMLFDPQQGTCYSNQKWCTEREVADTKEGYDYPVIRYAEVLLNYAEAVYEGTGKMTAEAYAAINEVRQRANPGMPGLSDEFITTNGLDLQTEIRRERTIELYQEGFRIDDLRRWKTAEVEMPQDMVGIKKDGTAYGKVNLKYPMDENGRIIIETGRKWAQKNYLHPIPSEERQLNPNLGQNPGW